MKKMKLNKKGKIAVIILVVVLLVSIFTVNGYNNSLDAVSDKNQYVYFTVEQGDTLDSVTSRLEKQKIIRNAKNAKIAGKLAGTTAFSFGPYKVNKAWNTKQILEHLSNPKNIVHDEVMLTFREGMWAKDIAKKIGENTNVSSEELLKLWNNDKFLKKAIKKYDFLTKDILNSEYRVKLEGYLYPETYSFNKKNSTAEEITYRFLDQFDQVYKKYLKSGVKKTGMSVQQLVTLASVIQYEGATKKDMKMISGVFYNRLKKGQKLEASATVCYALYNFDSWEDCETRYDVQSPYNTYQVQGLPIGPILNPGKQALDAAVHPTKNDYYFYVADVKHDGKVYYSKTYEEHLKLIDKYGLNL